MKRSLNPREKRLLIACISVIFLVFNVLAFRELSGKRKTLNATIAQLQEIGRAHV